MHSDLSPHLHTHQCNKVIEMLIACHRNEPFRRFLGYCNKEDYQVVCCLKNEREEKRKNNAKKSKELHKKVRRMIREDMRRENENKI